MATVVDTQRFKQRPTRRPWRAALFGLYCIATLPIMLFGLLVAFVCEVVGEGYYRLDWWSRRL